MPRRKNDDPNWGGARQGAGRKPSSFTLRKGQHVILERETIGGEIRKPELCTVLSISKGELELQTGNDIIVVRVPDEGEVG